MKLWILLLAVSLSNSPPLDASVLRRHPHQAAFCKLAEIHRTAAFFGGLQAGKSIAGADALRHLLYEVKVQLPEQVRGILHPEVWILSKSFTLADTAWYYFRWRAADAVYSPEECKSLGLLREDSRTFWLKPLGRADRLPIRVRVRTAHDPEQLRATPVLLAAWCDEVAHWPELAWLNLQGRGIVTKTHYLMTTTPKGQNYCFKDVFVPGREYRVLGSDGGAVRMEVSRDGGDSDIGILRCRSVDNPWADAKYLTKLRKKFGPAYADQELEALFTQNIGLVYSFDRSMMVEPPSYDPEKYTKIVFGVDPGYGDPYAVGVYGKHETRGWWVLDEFYKESHCTVLDEDLVSWMNTMTRKWQTDEMYVDKRRPTDWTILRKNLKFNARPNLEIYDENDRRTIMPMVRLVQGLMTEGRLHVAPHCEWHADELENYSFPDREAKNRGENPVDYRNHLMDAMRYAICSVDSLPEDRRSRFRQRPDMVPRPVDGHREVNIDIPPVNEYMAAMDRKMDVAEDMGRRQDHRRQAGGRRFRNG